MPERPKNMVQRPARESVEDKTKRTAADDILDPQVKEGLVIRASVRLTEETHKKLKVAGLKTGRSISSVIGLAIKEYFENHPELL